MEATAELARMTGDHARAFFGSDLVVESKTDGSPVTIADRSAEELAREWIGSRFPADGVLGEEFGAENTGRARRWILDPIDGTKSFVHGVPLWGTLVAVAEGNRVIAGAAYFPALGDIVVAATGEGCWWNDHRCTVSSVTDLSKATVLTSEHFSDERRRQQWRGLELSSAIVRTWGDCYGYFLVATGRAEVMADPALSAWDIAPFLPIVAEAGGVITAWGAESPLDARSAIATNAALATSVREILERTTEVEKR